MSVQSLFLKTTPHQHQHQQSVIISKDLQTIMLSLTHMATRVNAATPTCYVGSIVETV